MSPPHQLREATARRSLVVATRVCWRTTQTNEVCISGHFRVFRSACCARKSFSRSRLLGHFRLQFPCLAIGDRPRRPQDAGERPRRLSGGQMPPNGHRTPESGPDGSLGARCPQTATGRRRAAQTALWGPDAPKRPQDAGDRPRRPQDAGERPRRPQDAGERPRRPQDAGERPRRPQDAGERPRRPQDAGERPRRPQDAGDRPYSQQDPNLSSWTRLEGVDPPLEPPFFYLTHLGRAPARAYARALCARARDFGLLISHTGRD